MLRHMTSWKTEKMNKKIHAQRTLSLANDGTILELSSAVALAESSSIVPLGRNLGAACGSSGQHDGDNERRSREPHQGSNRSRISMLYHLSSANKLSGQ